MEDAAHVEILPRIRPGSLPAVRSYGSPAQRARWKNAINSFIKAVGDKAMVDINRDDGRAFYKFWLAKPLSKAAKDRRSANIRSSRSDMLVKLEKTLKRLRLQSC